MNELQTGDGKNILMKDLGSVRQSQEKGSKDARVLPKSDRAQTLF